MRKPFIAGNWKMNMTNKEAYELVTSLKEKVAGNRGVDVLVAPPFTALAIISELLRGSEILLAGQNLHHEDSGAFTGEISGAMLKGSGCSHVLIGHSERRQYFGCTDELVNKKIRVAVKNGLSPIVCIGETLVEREESRTLDVLRKQLADGLRNLSLEEREVLTVAYEPVWAIGTGRTASPDQAQEAHKFIRGELSAMYGEEFAQKTRIQYGGSVNPDNVSQIMSMPDVDGALVGGASLKADSFAKIVNFKMEKEYCVL
ncbi:MAG: triose-phosphate isomerase [Elusimicrobia bacterium]|nr:triose-phosphate isomerase [Elusimicrobiota bacterium]